MHSEHKLYMSVWVIIGLVLISLVGGVVFYHMNEKVICKDLINRCLKNSTGVNCVEIAKSCFLPGK